MTKHGDPALPGHIAKEAPPIFKLVEPGDVQSAFTLNDVMHYQTMIVGLQREASRDEAMKALIARDRELLDAILSQDE